MEYEDLYEGIRYNGVNNGGLDSHAKAKKKKESNKCLSSVMPEIFQVYCVVCETRAGW